MAVPSGSVQPTGARVLISHTLAFNNQIPVSYLSNEALAFLFQVRFMAARASVAFITDQVEEVKQRQFVDLVPGIMQVRAVMLW